MTFPHSSFNTPEAHIAHLERRLAALENQVRPILELFGDVVEMNPIGHFAQIPTRTVAGIPVTDGAWNGLKNFYERLLIFMSSEKKTLPGHYAQKDPNWPSDGIR
jgi:hypothetical protein